MHGLDTISRLNKQAVALSRIRKDNNGSRFAEATKRSHAKSTVKGTEDLVKDRK